MPGYVFFFKGLGKGAYAKGEKLGFTSGKPLTVGYASAVSVADWDRDGKLDLVIGTIEGGVWFVPNESRDGKLLFGEKRAVMAGDDEVRVNDDAGPLVADWDGDGIPDLLVGSGDGSVGLYRGSGRTGMPTLGEEESLISRLDADKDYDVHCERDPATGKLREGVFERPGIRTKLAVYDWNGDGKLDLLVGDMVATVGPEPELSEVQKKEKNELEAQERKVSDAISKLYEKANVLARLESKVAEDESDPDVEERQQQRADEILSKDPEYRALSERSAALWAMLNPFLPARETHGFVWVYARTADLPRPPRTAADATQLPPNTKDALLAFRVTAKESGKPLRSVAITATPKEPSEDFSWTDSRRSKGTIHESLRPDEQGAVEFTVPAGVGFRVEARDKNNFGDRGTMEVSALSAGERRELPFAIPTEDDLVFHGRVVRGPDGTPVSGARVRIVSARRSYFGDGDEMRERWSTEKLGETTSDAEGRFHVAAKSWKAPHLEVEADGFSGKPVALTADHATADKALDVRLVAPATVRARILDAKGNPLPGVAVVFGARGYEILGADEDDSSLAMGRVQIPDAEWKGESGPGGACLIQGIVPGVPLSLLLQRDGKTLKKQPGSLSLKAGEERAIEWKIGAGCTLQGIALDQEKKPVVDQRILLALPGRGVYFQSYEHDDVVANTMTDASGRFVFEDVPQGSWRVGPSARGYDPSPDPAAVAPLSQEVEVGEGGSKEIVVHAWRGRYVRGTVLTPDGGKAPRSFVTAQNEAFERVISCNPKEDGTFTLGPLGPGAIELVAQEFQIYAPSEPVRVEPGATDVVLRLKEGGRILANVVDAKTGEACAAEVTVSREDPSKDPRREFDFFSPVKEDGKFERPGLEPGRYGISARTRDGRFGILRGVEVTTEKESATRAVRVSPGGRIRVRYKGSKPNLLVTMAAQGVEVGVFGNLKAGAMVEQPAPSGAVTLKIYRDFPGEPRTKEVVVAQGETKEVVLGDED